jgi:hypothetical protein
MVGLRRFGVRFWAARFSSMVARFFIESRRSGAKLGNTIWGQVGPRMMGPHAVDAVGTPRRWCGASMWGSAEPGARFGDANVDARKRRPRTGRERNRGRDLGTLTSTLNIDWGSRADRRAMGRGARVVCAGEEPE